MHRLVIFLAVLLVPVLGWAGPVRVCIIGDSITAGFSPATRGWSVDLAALNVGSDFGVKNLAHAGDKVAAAQVLFDSDIPGRGCRWVAFLIGTNDLPDGTSAATIFAGIEAMAAAAEANGARVLGLAILPRGTGASWTPTLQTKLEAVNASLAARVSTVPGRPYVFVGTYAALLEPASSPPALAAAAGGATDGLHPSNAGELLIAQTAQAAVLAAGGW